MDTNGSLTPPAEHVHYVFGEFEIDAAGTTLRRGGGAVPVPSQSLALLVLLVSQPGAIVTRDRIREAIWPDVTVDFDVSINSVIRNLRRALGDDARQPRYIETVQRHGYRFIGEARAVRREPAIVTVPPAPRRVRRRVSWLVGVALVSVMILFVLGRTVRGRSGTAGQGGAAFFDFRSRGTDVVTLEQQGLRVLNYDAANWRGGPAGEPLVLLTQRGDFWRKRSDPRLPPRNVVAWPQSSPWFRATLKIGAFLPRTDWQQAGLVILADPEGDDYVRLTYASSSEVPYGKIQMVAARRAEDILYTHEYRVPAPVAELSLRIIREGDVFLFESRLGEDHHDWKVLDFPLDPARFRMGQHAVAVAAFQGVSDKDGRPLDQPPAAANIESLEILPLEPGPR
jgi:DNA-binding winged helix-turn-helix (wHTH) protein